MTSTYWPNDTRVECPFKGLQAVAINDLMWSDKAGGSYTLKDGTTSARGYAYRAGQMPDQSSEAANQALFAPRFIGVAKEAMTVTQTRDKILVDRVYVGPMTIASGTYYQGQLVTVCETSATDILENAKVVVTTTVADAIGYILKDSGGAVTTVTVMLISRVLPQFSLVQQVLNSAGAIMDDAANIATCTTTGTKIGTAVGQKIGFWNVAPTAQPSGAAQAAMVATVGAVQAATTGAATNTFSPLNSTDCWGYATNAIATEILAKLNTLRVDVLAHNTALNLIRTDVLAANTLVNALQAALLLSGLIKGSA